MSEITLIGIDLAKTIFRQDDRLDLSGINNIIFTMRADEPAAVH